MLNFDSITISDNFIYYLEKMYNNKIDVKIGNFINEIKNYNKVAQFILNLQYIDKSKLLDYPIDFIDIDKNGNFYGVSRRNLNNNENGFKSKKRRQYKIVKLLTKIVNQEYYNNNLNQKDIENFVNEFNALLNDSYIVKILEGNDILDAYDHTKISQSWKYSSCANFSNKNQTKNFDFYIKNPDNVKCVVVYYKGLIRGRRMMFTGVQTENHGKLKKGYTYSMLNYMYGEGGRGSKIDNLIIKWAKINNIFLIENLSRENIFRIKVNNLKFKFPPIDNIYINFENNELSSFNVGGFLNAYEIDGLNIIKWNEKYNKIKI